MANCTSQMALEEALRYAHEREAFGKPLAKMQVIRHKLADMATQIEASREFTYRVAARIEAGIPSVKEVANFVTKSNLEDGVAYVIEKFVLN